MKFKKRFLSILLSIVFIFGSLSPSISVYASNNNTPSGSNYLRNNFDKVVTWSTGVITGTRNLISNFFDFLGDHRQDLDIPEGTSTDDWLDDNILIDDNGGITISDSVINSMRDVVNNYITNDTGFTYAYTFSGADFLEKYLNQTAYHSFLDVLSANAGSLCYVSCPNSTNSYPQYIAVLKDNTQLVRNGTDVSVGTPTYTCLWYLNWENLAFDDMVEKNYFYDTNSSTYILVDNTNRNGSGYGNIRQYNNAQSISNCDYKRFYCSLNRSQVILYNSFESMRLGTEGIQPYYITDSYNTNHIDNSMTTTLNDLSNTISYSNVSNYVNSYYIQNQTYPSSQDTYNYINNYNGGGGNGDGNGNGEDDNPFSWIGLIGDFIKGLLSGIKGAIEGILDVLTSVVDIFLGEKDENGNRSGGIPTIISEIISYFLPFLPEWVPRLIEFSIIIALSLGIIRLIRGS